MAHILAKTLIGVLLASPIACGNADQKIDAAAEVTLSEPVVVPEVKPVLAEIDVSELPRQFLVETDLLHADIRIPDEVFVIAPALAQNLVSDVEAALETAKQTADAQRSIDPKGFRPHILRVEWQVTGAGGGLISLEQFIYDYSGGAHATFATHGRIYDTLTRESLSFRNFLVSPESAVNAHMDVILDALMVQKLAAGVSPDAADMARGELSDLVTADMVLSGAVSLVDATAPGKFGAYVVHFAPYEIGAFAEGAYHVTVPQSDFKPYLKPQYADMFAGAPIAVDRPDDK